MTEADRLARNADVPLALADIVVMAARQFDIPVRDLRSAAVRPEAYAARLWAVSKACSVPNDGSQDDGRSRLRKHLYSYWQIARALNRDHSTIMHAERRAREAGL